MYMNSLDVIVQKYEGLVLQGTNFFSIKSTQEMWKLFLGHAF